MTKNKHLFLLGLILVLPTQVQSQENSDAILLDQINTLRQSAGMTPLVYSKPLKKAAQNHANYLIHHLDDELTKKDMHAEHPKQSGFTGKSASTRAKRIGYPYKGVKENISAGDQDSEASIDGLMAGIYHRFTFLDFLIDNVGYGVATNNKGYKTHVYNMGRQDMEAVCTNSPKQALPKKPFDCMGKTVNAEYIEKACSNIPQEAIYQAPFPTRCPNGELLKASYMETICQSPPAQARFKGKGSYFKICEPRIQVDAAWLEGVCRSKDPVAIYSHSPSYYKICGSKTRVYSSWLKTYCNAASTSDQNLDTSNYSKACNSAFKVNKKHSDKLDNKHLKRNPDYVMWPPFLANEVTPVFYDEIPDPLPDLQVSGYPLSLQFNPGKVKSVKLDHFKLEKMIDENTRQSIDNIREINQKNDPQKIFNTLQFAWFPLQRLDWNTRYQASVSAIINGKQQLIKWAFKTQTLAIPVLKITPDQDTISVPEGNWFALYLLPDKRVNRPMKKTKLSWHGPVQVESEIIDLNTIKVRLNHTRCQPVGLQMSQGRRLVLKTCSQ